MNTKIDVEKEIEKEVIEKVFHGDKEKYISWKKESAKLAKWFEKVARDEKNPVFTYKDMMIIKLNKFEAQNYEGIKKLIEDSKPDISRIYLLSEGDAALLASKWARKLEEENIVKIEEIGEGLQKGKAYYSALFKLV